jgi:hypothetical protein
VGLPASLPINLTSIAHDLGVSAVRFRSILGSAGLLKTQDGFDIVVSTDARGAPDRGADVLPTDSSDWNVFSPPVRFSIAHELAQLLLLRTAGGDPSKEIFFKNEEALDTLSNQVAANFLMPRDHLRKAIGKHLFDAPHLARVVGQFRVSAEAFMWRLSSPDLIAAFPEADGILVLLREEGTAADGRGVVIRCAAGKIWGARALNQFGLGPKNPIGKRDTKFPAGRTVEELKLGDGVSRWLRENQCGIRRIEVPWRGDQPRNLLSCEAHYQRLGEKFWVLAIRVLAGPTAEL